MSGGSRQTVAAHIAVLGYWLGSELVINSTFRYVCRADWMAFPGRDRLMEHVMHVDQYVRHALVLQASPGTRAKWLCPGEYACCHRCRPRRRGLGDAGMVAL